MAVPQGTDYGTSPSEADELLAIDPPLDPGTVVGEFVIEAQIGRGGFGTVYRARHPVIGKRAAIKVLADDVGASQNAVARFIQEARAVNEIQHPNIVDVFSFGQLPDKRHYFAMELLVGQPFDAFLYRRDPLAVRELVAILDPVVRALDAAHGKGIVHRDLKPENIFLCFRDGRLDKVKLLDFGIAKLSAGALQNQPGQPKTKTGTPIGTPTFMSPEQCLALPVSAATDVYALGVICYVALTGEPPFYSDSIVNLLALHISVAPPPLGSRYHGVPKEVDAVVLRMLAKKPEERFASAGEALDALVGAARRAGLDADRRAQITIADEPLHPRTIRKNVSTAVSASTGQPVTSDSTGLRNGRDPRVVAAVSALLLGAVVAMTIVRLRESKEPAAPSPPVSAATVTGTSTTPATPGATVSTPAVPTVVESTVDAVQDAGVAKTRAVTTVKPPGPKPTAAPSPATAAPTTSAAPRPLTTGPHDELERPAP